MLAVHNARMGSREPSRFEPPFGYSFEDSAQDYSIPSPPALVSGVSILDDNESRLLDNFFEGMASDQFYHTNVTNPNINQSSFEVDWNNIPINYLDSSFPGQQIQVPSHDRLSESNFPQLNVELTPSNMISPASAGPLQQIDLLQNIPDTLGSDESLVQGRQGLVYLPQVPQLQMVQDVPGNQIDVQQMYLSNLNGEVQLRNPTQSEFSFDQQPVGVSNHQSLQRYTNWSPNATYATISFLPTSSGAMDNSTTYHRNSNEILLSPIVEDLDEEDYKSPQFQDNKGLCGKRKAPKKDLAESSTANESSHKRKKSLAGLIVGKSTRENLSEEQKRSNHIKSEQKRRTQIREGFDDLNDLVPGLRGGGFSKSAVLAQAADFLFDMIHGNSLLENRIDCMKNR